MKIDLREIPTRWINLDRATRNAKEMVDQFDRLGIKTHVRISGREIPPPPLPVVRLRAFGKHFVGCGQSHIDAIDSMNGQFPFLILEDDAVATSSFSPILEIPDKTDAVYLGVSHGNGKQVVIDNGGGWCRVIGMLTTHAILYLSSRFANHARQVAKQCIYDKQIPLDNGFAALQQQYNVLACTLPMFVQGDSRDSANKWEKITSRPLKPTHHVVQNKLTPIDKDFFAYE